MVPPVQLSFTEMGQGQPLILLHGFPLNNTIFLEQAKALSDHYRTITPDLRGHGQSPVPEGTYDMELMAHDVFRLMDRLGIDKAPIMGHSMGGYVALAGYKLDPSRFQALGLICSHAWADTAEQRRNREKQAEDVFLKGSGVMAEAMLPRLFSPDVTPDEAYIEQVKSIILATRPQGIVNSLRGIANRADSSVFLAQIAVPVLILTGDSDQIVPTARAEAMAAAVREGTLITVENAGHMPMLEQPQATALAIRTFLGELNPHKAAG